MKRKCIFTILILIIIFQTGCWDMEEINEIGLVTVVGIDYSLDTNRYIVTAQIANPSPKSIDAKAPGASSDVWVGSTDGDSIFEALRNLARISSKRVTWSHNTIVILGEDFAKHDITPAIDFFTHSPQLRMKTIVVVSKGAAKNYVASNVGLSTNNGIAFLEMSRYSSLPAVSIKSNMLKLASDFSDDYSQMLVSRIDRKTALLSADDKNNVTESDAVAIEGSAVFKKSKMVGWLTPDETRGLAWILNNAQDTISTVVKTDKSDDSDSKYNRVSIEVKKVKCKIDSKVVEGIPNINIKISGEGNIVEEDGTTNLNITKFKKEIETLLDKKIIDEINRGVNKVQKYYESDVLGFAQIVRVDNNEIWKNSLKNDWQKTFPNLPININVKININTSTLAQKPTTTTKGK